MSEPKIIRATPEAECTSIDEPSLAGYELSEEQLRLVAGALVRRSGRSSPLATTESSISGENAGQFIIRAQRRGSRRR